MALRMIGPRGAPSPTARAEIARYDKRRLSYATTFDSRLKRLLIRAVEWMTGKARLLGLIRRFEAEGVPDGQAFWAEALRTMSIQVTTPAAQVARIPAIGPTVVVANHPHGLVDGMVLAEIVGRVRQDYRILTRSLLTEVDEVKRFLIPVPFPHEKNALQKNLEMRRTAMVHLAQGGTVVLFPAGVVAHSETMFGPAVEAEWSAFTARMIRRSGASVVPVRFTGRNSRAYQIANRISPALRQGLLIHEVVRSCNVAQAPIVGEPIAADEIAGWAADPRGFMAWLRARTLAMTE